MKIQLLPTFCPLHWRNPAIVGQFRIHLHVFDTSFKRQNDVTPSNAITDIILQWQMTSASACFPHTFKTVTSLFHEHDFLAMAIQAMCVRILNTVKPVLSGHSKIDKTKTFMTNGSLMKVESIAECSPWSILQYFWPALSDNRSWKLIFGLLFECPLKTGFTVIHKTHVVGTYRNHLRRNGPTSCLSSPGAADRFPSSLCG